MPKFKPGTIKTYREYAVKGVQPEYDRLKAEIGKLEELFPELRGKASISMKKAWRQRKAAAADGGTHIPKRGRGRPRKDATVAAKPERKAARKVSKKKKAAPAAETGTGDNQ